jgi:hypothetical protein
MKFSTEIMVQITQILMSEFEDHLAHGKPVAVAEMEQGLRQALREIGQQCLGEMLTRSDTQTYGVRITCACQERARRVSRRRAQLLSIFGWISYRRSYYHCVTCGRRWVALDEQEGLRPGRATPGMARLLALAGVTVSFEEACRQIGEYLQVAVSVNTVRKETQLFGQRQQQREAQWIANSQDRAYLQERERHPRRPKRVYGSMDGALVPLGQGWKEEKTISWYQAGQRYGSAELRAIDIHYYTSLEEAHTFGKLVWATAVQHQADQAEEVVFVCDGAPWIWKLVEHYFPQAVQIVDWYHACQYLYPVAEALFGADDQAGQQWVQAMKDWLWQGDVAAVIRTCHQLVAKNQGGQPVQAALTYFTNNQARMNYAYFREQGYFIGSGTVESACKQIVAMRLKRSGARWTFAGASATAKARAAWLSGAWDILSSLPLAA